jgi:hypothetical protein
MTLSRFHLSELDLSIAVAIVLCESKISRIPEKWRGSKWGGSKR